MQVEIDVFSGRPNPVLTLTASQTIELESLLQNLQKAPSAPPQAGLGYRGFVIACKGGLAGLTCPLRVFDGFVIEEGTEKRAEYRDSASCESWLKQQAAAAGWQDLF